MISEATTVAFQTVTERIAKQFDVDSRLFLPSWDVAVRPWSATDGAILYEAGSDEENLYVVEAGWLMSFTLLEDGGRYISRVYQPGDIVGMEDTNWNRATSTIEALTDVRLWAVPKVDYKSLLNLDTRFGAVLHGIAMNDKVVMVDRARSNSRFGGMERVGHFLLQLESRYALNSASSDDRFPVPLTQLELADCTGMSHVHTNKSMRRLQREEYISRDRGTYRILRRKELVKITEFVNRFAVTNRAWLQGLLREAPARVANG